MSVVPEFEHAKPRVKLTYDDYLLFPEDGKRHELIDGEHYVTPSPHLRHQEILGRLHLLIGVWLERHSRGRLFFAPLDVILSHHNVLEPDLLHASHARAGDHDRQLGARRAGAGGRNRLAEHAAA